MIVKEKKAEFLLAGYPNTEQEQRDSPVLGMCEIEYAARRAVPTGVALPFAPAAYLKDAEHRAGANHVITAVSIGFSQNQPWIFCCFSWIAFLPAPCHCVCTGIARIKNQEETNMTIDTAKELQMNIAKEGLALLVLHPTADVQLHRECISHIGTAWDIPFGDTQEVISLLDRELDAIHAAEKNGTVTHVLPEEELPMNASGLETLDNIWDLFETSLRVDSPYARTRLFEMAKWLEESQNLLDWIEKTPAEKQAWMEQVS